MYQIRQGTAQVMKDASSLPYLARKAIKPTRMNAKGEEEPYEDLEGKKSEEEGKRFARKLMQDKAGTDYLE
jgi:hypothetical protein